MVAVAQCNEWNLWNVMDAIDSEADGKHELSMGRPSGNCGS
jgi:hypothetical protein